jgi:hypothetical protein
MRYRNVRHPRLEDREHLTSRCGGLNVRTGMYQRGGENLPCVRIIIHNETPNAPRRSGMLEETGCVQRRQRALAPSLAIRRRTRKRLTRARYFLWRGGSDRFLLGARQVGNDARSMGHVDRLLQFPHLAGAVDADRDVDHHVAPLLVAFSGPGVKASASPAPFSPLAVFRCRRGGRLSRQTQQCPTGGTS